MLPPLDVRLFVLSIEQLGYHVCQDWRRRTDPAIVVCERQYVDAVDVWDGPFP